MADFARTKPHVNVGTIGHVDHGKTTLTTAILATQARDGLATMKAYADIAKGGTVRDETKVVTISLAHVEYESATRHYAHIDAPAKPQPYSICSSVLVNVRRILMLSLPILILIKKLLDFRWKLMVQHKCRKFL